MESIQGSQLAVHNNSISTISLRAKHQSMSDIYGQGHGNGIGKRKGVESSAIVIVEEYT